jgi:16S rRNA processing protein RimM
LPFPTIFSQKFLKNQRDKRIMDKKIIIAKIISAFGIRGEVKIISYCQNPLDIEKYPLFDQNNQSVELKISNKNKAIIGSTVSGDAILIVKITGINDRNLAEKIRGTELFCNRDDFKNLPKDEFYYTDLIGLEVIDNNRKIIGKVINVNDYGAGGMVEIEFSDNDLKIDKIMNFAFNHQFFPEVDLNQGFIQLILPEILEDKELEI